MVGTHVKSLLDRRREEWKMLQPLEAGKGKLEYL